MQPYIVSQELVEEVVGVGVGGYGQAPTTALPSLYPPCTEIFQVGKVKCQTLQTQARGTLTSLEILIVII